MTGIILFIICMIMGFSIGYVLGVMKVSRESENFDDEKEN